ncbi:MAG: superoxide dismutase [Defluviitaleaceae bacterium]|nr:superoxide dismutase [Defluviitaleaceae bacterium]
MHYKFTLQPLPYAPDALEPFIDTKTVEIHHGKHLQTYVDNLNKALEGHPDYHNWPLEKLLYSLDQLPQELQIPVRNNGGGVYNHNLYFSTMAPGGRPLPNGPLKDAINSTWGSLDNLKAQLKAAGLSVFGSGWAWIVADSLGQLSIFKTANQDTQIPANLTAVLIMDVWEHAYYLKVQNRRADYIDNWFNVVNWEQAAANYDKYGVTDYSKV